MFNLSTFLSIVLSIAVVLGGYLLLKLIFLKLSDTNKHIKSIVYFLVGFFLPLLIKDIFFHDELESHEAFWRAVEIYSGLSFLISEILFDKLENISEKQHTGFYNIIQNQNELLKELKSELELKKSLIVFEVNKRFEENLNKTTSEISSSISSQLRTEKTIMRIPLENNEVYQYLDSILGLHDSIGKSYQKSQVVSHALEIIKNSTIGLNNFFNAESDGGLYRDKDAVTLYTNLALKAKAITVIEPKYSSNLYKTYSTDYTGFIMTLADKSILKKYIYLSEAKTGETKEWLEKYKFKVDDIRVQGTPTQSEKKWAEYSHLLFEFDDFFITCSVLPLFDSDETTEITKENLTPQNFIKADYFYLAFRLIDAKNLTVSNGESWFKKLVEYHRKKDKSTLVSC
jgi:hypothetical protein